MPYAPVHENELLDRSHRRRVGMPRAPRPGSQQARTIQGPRRAQAQEDTGVLIVRETPTADQLELLRRAAAGGFAIEPYVAGEAWRETEEL